MKKRYRKITKEMPSREPRMLERYSLAEKQTSPVRLIDPYDQLAPGLYPDEQVVQLDTGEFIAVSVEANWLDGAGVALIGYARWVNEDGSSVLSPDGKQVEVSMSNSFDAGWLAKYSQSTLATEIIQLMLGEPGTMVPVEIIPGSPGIIPDDSIPETTKVDLESTEQPMIALSQEGREQGSIRTAIAHVKEMNNINISL